MDFAEWTDTMSDIARGEGLRLVVGDWPRGAEVVGSPPACASLVRLADGTMGVHISNLNCAQRLEQVLHEIAHHRFGLDDERRCYEWAAVQALRFPVEVSTAVASMAREVMW